MFMKLLNGTQSGAQSHQITAQPLVEAYHFNTHMVDPAANRQVFSNFLSSRCFIQGDVGTPRLLRTAYLLSDSCKNARRLLAGRLGPPWPPLHTPSFPGPVSNLTGAVIVVVSIGYHLTTTAASMPIQ